MVGLRAHNLHVLKTFRQAKDQGQRWNLSPWNGSTWTSQTQMSRSLDNHEHGRHETNGKSFSGLYQHSHLVLYRCVYTLRDTPAPLVPTLAFNIYNFASLAENNLNLQSGVTISNPGFWFLGHFSLSLTF